MAASAVNHLGIQGKRIENYRTQNWAQKIPVWWRRAVLPSLFWVVCFASFFLLTRGKRILSAKNVSFWDRPSCSCAQHLAVIFFLPCVGPSRPPYHIFFSGGEALAALPVWMDPPTPTVRLRLVCSRGSVVNHESRVSNEFLVSCS